MEIAKSKYLITVVGPTAIGKTALAIEIARHYKCEILSADSRQFYKEMTIGTAVPSAEELAAVPHHFIQDKSIFQEYTVGDFEREATSTLDNFFTLNNYMVLVGGSGLYINAILKGFDDFPGIDPSIREKLVKDYGKFGITHLQKLLRNLDPVQFEKMAIDNPQRLMRALEVCIGTGKPYSSFLNQKKNQRNFTPIIIGLEGNRQEIYDRINNRVDTMLLSGLLAEAKALHPYKKLNALQTVGYRELFAYLDNEITLECAIDEIKKNTRRFSKRQMTWFKRNENTTWFDYKTPISEIINYIEITTNAYSQ